MKAVFFDIDGTLISWKTKTYPPSAAAAIARLREKGVKCLIATGRSMHEIRSGHMLDGLEFDGYLTNHGQVAFDASGKIFHETPIDRGDIAALLDWLDQTGAACWLIGAGVNVLNHCDSRVERALEAIHTALPDIGSLRQYSARSIYRIALFLRPEELPRGLFPHCRVTRWNEFGHDLFSAAGGKRVAMEAALAHYGLRREEVMAFGDWDNDIEMLQYAGVGVAMGGATDGAKAAADYVTDDCDDDGIWNALKHFSVI